MNPNQRAKDRLMKTRILNLRRALATLAVLSTLNVPLSTAFAQGTTAFTYHGRLTDTGSVPNGEYLMSFAIFPTNYSGSSLFSITNTVPVSNGLFTVTLDFGGGIFDGAPRWLELGVSTNGPAAFTTLQPRQRILPTPYAILASTAATVSSDAIYNAHIASGQVVKSLNGLRDDVTLLAGTNITLTTFPNSNLMISASNGDSVWSLNGSNAYYNGGNVGIGTSAPTSPLHVRRSRGRMLLDSTNSTSGSLIEMNNYTDNSTALGRIIFTRDFIFEGMLEYLTGAGLAIHAGGEERVRVAGNGNVGIGTTSPAYRLDVAGQVRAGGAFLAPWGPILTVPAGPNTNLLTMRWDGINGDRVDLEVPGATANNALFSFTSNGRLGIGTSSPGAKLDVTGAGQFGDRTLSLGNITGHPNERVSLYYDGSVARAKLIGASGVGLSLGTGGSADKVTIDTSGNVGIGTAAPGAPLQVERAQASARLRSTSTANGSVLELWNASSGFNNTLGAINFINAGASVPGQIAYVDDDGFHFRAGGLPNLMVLDVAGNLGIGRTATANKLEVEGTASKSVAGSWLANSDRRIKRDVEPLTDALDRMARVRLVRFHYTDEYRKAHPGVEDREYLNVIAQEFREVFPEHVKASGEKLPDGAEILQVDTYPLTIYSAAAIQELNQKLEQRLEQKETEITKLKQRLERLEQLVSSKLNGGAK